MSRGRQGAPPSRPPVSLATGDTTVVCVGNTLMADDGVAAAVARDLEARGLPRHCSLDVRAHADMSLVGILRQSRRVIVVDAIDLGAEPGSVYRFTPEDAGIVAMRSHNTHGMGLGYAVASAKLLGAEPDVIVYGIQVGDIRPSPDTLSEQVAAAVPDVAALVSDELRRPA